LGAEFSRRALVIGVGDFDLSDDGFPALPFAPDLARKLAEVLTGYRDGGFSVRLLTDPDREEISRAVREFLDDTSTGAAFGPRPLGLPLTVTERRREHTIGDRVRAPSPAPR
jgi:hypothetical protein